MYAEEVTDDTMTLMIWLRTLQGKGTVASKTYVFDLSAH